MHVHMFTTMISIAICHDLQTLIISIHIRPKVACQLAAAEMAYTITTLLAFVICPL